MNVRSAILPGVIALAFLLTIINYEHVSEPLRIPMFVGLAIVTSLAVLALRTSQARPILARANNLSPEELSAIKDAIELGYRATANNDDGSNISELTGHFEQQTVAWQHSAEHVFASQARASPADSKSQNPRVLSFRHASV